MPNGVSLMDMQDRQSSRSCPYIPLDVPAGGNEAEMKRHLGPCWILAYIKSAVEIDGWLLDYYGLFDNC